jgi:hypothetical protein
MKPYPTTMIQKPSDPPEPCWPASGQALSWLGLRFETADGREGEVVMDTNDHALIACGGTKTWWTRRAFADALIAGQVTWL